MIIRQVVAAMIDYFQDDVRRVAHALKVYGYAQAIAANEQMDSAQLVALETAAVLHDIGIHEAERLHGSSAGPFQELEGPPVARKILEKLRCDGELNARVCYLVGHHHSYDQIDGIDFQILVEADFLVNIEEDGLSQDAVRIIRKKYFKTASGTGILTRLYALED